MSITTGTLPSGADYIGLNEGMKILFEPAISNELVQDQEVFDLIESDLGIEVQQSKQGRYIETAHYAADGGGFGARTEGGALPEASNPSIFNGRVYLRKSHMTVQMSGEAMRRSQAGPAGWITWAEEALPNAVRRFRHHLDRMSMGYGAGAIARISAINGATLTLDRAYGITGYTYPALGVLKNDFIRVGTDAVGTVMRATRAQVTAVNIAANTITVNAVPSGTIVGDFIFIGDNADHNAPGGASGTQKEMMGLLGIVDDGSVLATFQNVVRANQPEYQSLAYDVNALHAGVFSEDTLQAADDEAYIQKTSRPDFILMHRAHERRYWYYLKQDRQITAGPQMLLDEGGKPLGFSIMLNGRQVVARSARKVPPQIAMMLVRGTLKRWQNGGGFSWDDTTGSIFERVVDASGRRDAYYATGVYEAQHGSVSPQRNVVLRGINPAA